MRYRPSPLSSETFNLECWSGKMSLNCDLSALLHCHFDSQTTHSNFMVFFSPYLLEHTAVRKIDMSEKVFEVDIIT